MTRILPGLRPARAVVPGLLAGALTCTLVACGAGHDAVTARYYSPADGVSAVVGELRVLNALVVAPSSGGTSAVVSMMIANDGDQPETISRVTTEKFGEVAITGSRDVPAHGALVFGGPTGKGTATVNNFTAKSGETVTLDVEFAKSTPVRGLRTVVTPATGYYAGFVVTPTAPVPTSAKASPPQVSPGAPAGTGGANAANPSGTNVRQPQPPRQS